MNREISCEQIRDMLPSYIDGVCSEETRQAIEVHLKTCDKCQAQAAAMREPIEVKKDGAESELLQKISVAWKKSQRNAFETGVLVTLMCLLIINIVFYFVSGMPVIGSQPSTDQLYLVPVSHSCAIVGVGILLARKIKERKKEN